MIGTRLTHYEITSHLGTGGMGEVYQASDSKLGRSVAIKLLPEAFSHDNDRVARFEREARVLASLNHPGIAAIHGLEESGGRRFLVLELVPGETLAERIKRGAIPIDEVLGIAKQIAEALEAAHEKGVLHRDLKPANIKITPDGKVKVLDFGLAKAFEAEASGAQLSHSPTLSFAATNAGIILGTAAYMSPEQARGMTLDRRTDIFAFGAVLYEMLTGRQAFQGDTVSDILASVLKLDPDWNRLPSETPASIRRLLRRCLQKERSRRLDTAAGARIEIEEAHADAEPKAGLSIPLMPERARLPWILVAALSVVAVSLAIPAVRYLRQNPVEAPEMRLDIVTPTTADAMSFALSPDGQKIAFVASGDGVSRLWVRSLNATEAQPLAGTEAAATPFWSPDGRSVGFFAGGKLKRIDIGGGAPQTLPTAVPRGGSWNAEGTILFAATTAGPLMRVRATGGEAMPVTKLDRQTSHRYPYFLPDGRHFLFYALGTPETGGIYLGSLDTMETHRLTAADTQGIYVAPGWLLWVRSGTLAGQRLDLEQKALVGEPVTVADPVAFDVSTAGIGASASARGAIAYRAGGATRRQLTWFDRSGKPLGTMGAPDENGLSSPSVSPDGRRVAAHRTVLGNTDIWIFDGARTSRFTFDAAFDRFHHWAPDGIRFVFDSNRKGNRDIFLNASGNADAEEPIVSSMEDEVPTDWSADGRFILYQRNDPKTSWDLWVLPMEGERKPWSFLKTNFGERVGTFSPDGRWVTYMSNASGPPEIYIRPFVEPAAPGSTAKERGSAGGQAQVSTAGGIYPRWRPESRELFYIGPKGEMMAVTIGANGEPGPETTLFQTRMYGGGADNGQGWQYDVTRDGRFLINAVLDDEVPTPITLLQNWKPSAK